MKPRVFLSHSKKDKVIIEKIANDLRSARINVWYDDWEIPVGESFRSHIFEEGILGCDLFFIYLTPNSADSYWVKRELDAAFIKDAESKGGFIAIFVDEDNTRSLLSLDLRSLNSPILNEENYFRPLTQLVSRSWEGYLRKKTNEINYSIQIETLKLEKTIIELQNKITKLESSGRIDVESIIAQLNDKIYSFNDFTISLYDFVINLSNDFATGIIYSQVNSEINKMFKFAPEENKDFNSYSVQDFLGPLIIMGILYIKLVPWGDHTYETCFFTDYGVKVVREIIYSKKLS